MHNEKLDDPSNQETKETSLACIIGDKSNEGAVSEKSDFKIMQTNNGTKLAETEQVEQPHIEKSVKFSENVTSRELRRMTSEEKRIQEEEECYAKLVASTKASLATKASNLAASITSASALEASLAGASPKAASTKSWVAAMAAANLRLVSYTVPHTRQVRMA